MFPRAAWLALVLLIAPSGVLAGDRSLNLYEWIRAADVVVAGEVEGKDGKFTLVRVLRPIRGDLEEGDRIRVLVRRANRERRDEQLPMKVEAGSRYVILLDEVPADARAPRTFELVRGVHGARDLPSEGTEPFLEASVLFARIQDADDLDLAWHRFELMLEETNPLLIRTALEEYHRFRRGSPELVPTLRPLLDHPRPDIRYQTLELVGWILEGHPAGQVPARDELQTEIIGLARSDPSPDVRIAATGALAAFREPGMELVVEEISQDDPDQAVRYAAEKLLYEWEQAAAGSTSE